jgi:hypothetical protein
VEGVKDNASAMMDAGAIRALVLFATLSLAITLALSRGKATNCRKWKILVANDKKWNLYSIYRAEI